MNIQDIISAGGTLKPTPETKWWVSGWHIPNGSDYDKAVVRIGFFEDEEAAKKLAKEFDAPPEMATAAAFDNKAQEIWNRQQLDQAV